MKKILSLVLILVIIGSLLPVQVIAGEFTASVGTRALAPVQTDPEVEDLGAPYLDAVTKAFQAYVNTLPDPDAVDGVEQLVDHALTGQGKTLELKKTDPFVVSCLNSNLAKAGITDSVATAIDTMLQSTDTECLMKMNVSYYQSNLRYTSTRRDPSVPVETNMKLTGDAVPPTITKKRTFATSEINVHDEGMILVLGGGLVAARVQKIENNLDTVTFRAMITIMDEFNFDGKYKVNNDSLAIVMTAVGKFLALGLLDTYTFTTSFSFDITVPNPCSHTSANYRWEDSDTALISTSGTGLTANSAHKIEITDDEGATQSFYHLEDMVWLMHDRPWVLEFRSKGSGTISFVQAYSYASETPILVKENKTAYIGQSFRFTTRDSQTGEYKTQTGLDMYRMVKDKNLYTNEKTYRFENHVYEDGTNSVHFVVNGRDLGPLDQYWVRKNNKSENQKTEVDWSSGTDFLVNYIFNRRNLRQDTVELAYIQIWENGENAEAYDFRTVTTVEPTHGQAGSRTTRCERCGGEDVEVLLPHELKVTPGTATCTEGGTTSRIECLVCGLVLQEMVVSEALGHDWAEGTITKEPTCTDTGTILYTCRNDASHTKSEELPPQHDPETLVGYPATCTATGLTYGSVCKICEEVLEPQQEIPLLPHSELIDSAVSATCAKNGKTEGSHCDDCGLVFRAQETIPSLPHSYAEGVCTVCGEKDPDWAPPGPDITRLAGDNRYETALLAAEQMKQALGIEKFDNIVVASGTDFADALSGSYLASEKQAPILLASNEDQVNDLVRDYINENLKGGGTVYILGGTKAIPKSFETGLEDQLIQRLAGANRFETNLLILEEAGVGDQSILVCTGTDFADSLSASATKMPILLVYKNELLEEQKYFVESLQGRDMYIIGGTGAVSKKLEDQLKKYGPVERIAGGNRLETSVLIAKEFFRNPESAVLAYAWGFADGLCGGPLAAAMNVPLILTMKNYEEQATEYMQSNAIRSSIVLGGEKLIPEASIGKIFTVR